MISKCASDERSVSTSGCAGGGTCNETRLSLARQALALAVHRSLGVNSVQELISAAKQRGALGCATSGVGSNQHVLLEWFNRIAGVKLEHVPYRGAGQAINDLNHRLRYALGEYSSPPDPTPVP